MLVKPYGSICNLPPIEIDDVIVNKVNTLLGGSYYVVCGRCEETKKYLAISKQYKTIEIAKAVCEEYKRLIDLKG